MLNRVFAFLGQMLQVPFYVLFLDRMLPPRNDRCGIWGRVAAFCFSAAGSAAVKVFAPPGWWTEANATLYMALLVTLICLLYGGRPWKRMCAAAAVLVTMFLADMIYTNLAILLTGRQFSQDFSQPDMAVGCVLVNLLVIGLLPAMYWLWRLVDRRERGRSQRSTYTLFLLMEVPFFLVFMFSVRNYSDSGYVGWNYAMVFISIFCSAFAVAVILISQADREAMAERLREFRRLSEQERQYFSAVEARQEELSKLRHDYNNLLSSASTLLREGNVPEAEKLLAEISDSLRATRTHPYCAVPVVNAVLAEKAAVCDREGIALETRLILPPEPPVDRIDLCRALSNLMDNAIRGSAGTRERHIQLSGCVVRGYMVVKCVNTVSDGPPAPNSSGTGYGMQILKDLADRYKGDFSARREDGLFTAQLSLRVEA